MKKINFTLLCFLFLNILRGQDTKLIPTDTLKKKAKSYFGINAGITTGLGFSYIYWPKKNGLQVTFLPLFDKDYQNYSLSLTYLRFLTQYQNVNLFMFVGNHLTNIFYNEANYNIGIGPGVEASTGSIKFHFMLGYGVLAIPTDIKSRPTVEAGIFYNF
jgi:hypothetical protein